MLNGWSIRLSTELRALLDDDQYLPARHISRRYAYTILLYALLTIGVVLINSGHVLFATWHGTAVTVLFAIGLLAGIALQFATTRRRYMYVYGVALAAAVLLMLLHNDYLALIILPLVLFVALYRFPLRQALLIGILPTACYILVAVQTALRGPTPAADPLPWVLVPGVVVFALVLALVRRRQIILNQHLTWTKDQLDRELARSAHLAILQERARIARDMHDLLAHSLTMLSVQTQAARQTVLDEPQATARILDEMAETLRQSLLESRQLVQVLREATDMPQSETSLAEQLRKIGDQFTLRTGVQSTWLEAGSPVPISDDLVTTLRFATQEALTNAYRHGRARHVAFALRWEPDRLVFNAQDDGSGLPDDASPGSGNGLRGMRERVAALQGACEAGPLPNHAGFALWVSLPYAGSVRLKEPVLP